MKVYISGPITGTVGYMERFEAVEKLLTLQGHVVINPAKINAGLPPKHTTHQEYMDVSMILLGMCEGIYMMRGWKESVGANMEFLEAVNRGMSIVFEGGTKWPSQSKPRLGNLMKKLEKR